MLALSAWHYCRPFKDGGPNPRSRIWQLIEDVRKPLTKGLLIMGAKDLVVFRNNLLVEFGSRPVDRSIMMVTSSPQDSLAVAWVKDGLQRANMVQNVIFQG